MVALVAIQVALGPGSVISPSTASINSMLVATSPETRDTGVKARMFSNVAVNQLNLRGITLMEVLDLTLGRSIQRLRGSMKSDGIWGTGFLLQHPRPRNTKGLYLDHFLALDEMLLSSTFKDHLETGNQRKMRLTEAEWCRVRLNPAFHDLSGFGHATVGGHMG